ncbi:MAG: Telomerase protein component 1 [Phylliscum demangeonii]|nr:MAG: Telomerase protein component 1 [Phylliscum demangeonii]
MFRAGSAGDGLWRLLCPAIDTTFRRRAPASLKPSAMPRPWWGGALSKRSGACPFRRPFSLARTSPPEGMLPRSAKPAVSRDRKQQWHETPREQLYEHLSSAAAQGQLTEVDQLVTHFLQDRHEEPNVRLYNALILANVNAERGSAGKVAGWLRELGREGLVPDSGTFHHALKVLSVHPDHILRDRVLGEMRQLWISLTADGHHDLVASLVRDGALELALDKLDALERDGVTIAAWLYDLVIYTLLDHEEFDDALRVIHTRLAKPDASMSANVWYYLLDRASQAFHLDGTALAWRRRVETGYLNPPDGMCEHVLNTAARHGDALLAADVIRVLSNRDGVAPHHHEALAEAYLAASELKTALQIYSLATEAGHDLDERSMNALFQRLRAQPSELQRVVDVFDAMREEGRAIPRPAVHCVMQALIVRNRVRDAVQAYVSLRNLCPAGPNTTTFELLVHACCLIQQKKLAEYFVAEMKTMGVRASAGIYAAMVLLHARDSAPDAFDQACAYLAEMKALGWPPPAEAYVALINHCAQLGPDGGGRQRASALLAEMEAAGMSTGRIKAAFEHRYRKASLLRRLVAGPRLPHAETGLDLCYVTDEIIATSGPSSTYPQRYYRNRLDALVAFLDGKHGATGWMIWEFRAEGSGYLDHDVRGRVRHFPWPDHHPPPFALIPAIVGSMRDWLRGCGGGGGGGGESESESEPARVVVVHCKAGKGRSGTIACAYLIAEEGWTAAAALARFTERRMRARFGAGVSIPSQVRWVRYVEEWAGAGQPPYMDGRVQVDEVRVWGLRDGVTVAVEGFVQHGRQIAVVHRFDDQDRASAGDDSDSASDSDSDDNGGGDDGRGRDARDRLAPPDRPPPPTETKSNVRFRPRPGTRIELATHDVNIAVERRRATFSTVAPHAGLTIVTAVAHVWFNAWFEARRHPTTSSSARPWSASASASASASGRRPAQGRFSIDWDAMDGIKGGAFKGGRALDRLAVRWRVVRSEKADAEDAEEELAVGTAADGLERDQPPASPTLPTLPTPLPHAEPRPPAGASLPPLPLAATAAAAAAAAAASTTTTTTTPTTPTTSTTSTASTASAPLRAAVHERIDRSIQGDSNP